MRQRMLRKGGAVKRFHTIDTVKAQTVADHSWGVATIICDLWPDASVPLIRAALHHDVAEHITGDVPAPAKWQFPALADELHAVEYQLEAELGLDMELDALSAQRLKIADMMELLWYCVEEERLGNRNFKEVFVRGMHYLQDMDLDDAPKHMLDDLIKTEAEL